MTLVRWDPFRELSAMQERLNRIFGDVYSRRSEDDLMSQGTWLPPVDIYSNGQHELVLKAELPDMRREDIDLTVESGTLTISGEKKAEHEVSDDQFHRMERAYGRFKRAFSLPSTVDTGKVSAEYKNGVLTVRLPLRDEAKPKQIKIDVAA